MSNVYILLYYTYTYYKLCITQKKLLLPGSSQDWILFIQNIQSCTIHEYNKPFNTSIKHITPYKKPINSPLHNASRNGRFAKTNFYAHTSSEKRVRCVPHLPWMALQSSARIHTCISCEKYVCSCYFCDAL